MPNFLSVREAAEKLSCSRQTVRAMIRRGAVRAFRVGRFVRVDSESILALTGAEHESGAVSR
jgi:excisionase family DNA binding protein